MTADRYTAVLPLGGRAELRVYLGVLRGAAGFRRPVVLKRAAAGGSPAHSAAARAALEREAKVAAALDHPNLVHALELFEDAAGLTLSMEYVGGVSLQTLLEHLERTDGVMPWAVAARVVADAARGLAHAHRARDLWGEPLGIIHRDVSPKNLVVAEGGWSKVVDFGIARTASEPRSEDGLVRGTPGYLSPEQARGEELDARTDVFSLGVVLCELLTGRRPFAGERVEEALRAAELGAPPPMPDGVPPVLSDLVTSMLAADPERRTVRIGSVADTLEEAAGQHGAGHGTVATFLRAELGAELDRRRARVGKLLLAEPRVEEAAGADAPADPWVEESTLVLLERVLRQTDEATRLEDRFADFAVVGDSDTPHADRFPSFADASDDSTPRGAGAPAFAQADPDRTSRLDPFPSFAEAGARDTPDTAPFRDYGRVAEEDTDTDTVVDRRGSRGRQGRGDRKRGGRGSSEPSR